MFLFKCWFFLSISTKNATAFFISIKQEIVFNFVCVMKLHIKECLISSIIKRVP